MRLSFNIYTGVDNRKFYCGGKDLLGEAAIGNLDEHAEYEAREAVFIKHRETLQKQFRFYPVWVVSICYNQLGAGTRRTLLEECASLSSAALVIWIVISSGLLAWLI